MSALDDLDSLLGDLEKTCQQRQSSDDLDNMLQDLVQTSTPNKKALSDAVISEMKYHSKDIESKVGSQEREDGLAESKWDYKGFGIWETNKSASSATQELDDLMNSLNTFKVSSANESGLSAPPPESNLDAMLGDLKDDMDKQGVKVTPKGVCHACTKPIVGQVITALGKTWHSEHFVCSHCKNELANRNFFERDGQSYCEEDYHALFSPRCAKCDKAILDKCVSALDQTWHPDCFKCATCEGSFGQDGFHDKEGKAFCNGCFFEAFAPKCKGCDQPIKDNYVSSLDGQWHPSCFVCQECKEPFHEGNFFEHEGKPYCETHYHALRGSLCAGCRKPISGRCITAMFRKFHPEHFVCSFCLKQLNKGTFKERSEKPYCHECHDRLFG